MENKIANTRQEKGTLRRRVHQHEKKLRRLRRSIFITGVFILLCVLLMFVMPLFRVKSIRVEGNTIHSDEQIAAAAGIAVGNEIFSLAFDGIDQSAFYAACPYVKSVTLSYGTSEVQIEVSEATDILYAQMSTGEWISFDSSLHVYEKRSESSSLERFLLVQLPAIASAEVGGEIVFQRSELGYGYIADLYEVLKSNALLSRVSYLDLSGRTSMACVIDGRIRLELGSLSSMNDKIDAFRSLMTKIGTESYAIVDVSKPQNPVANLNVSEDDLYR